ncbi:MAG: RdgB/HAM1 family non-canonical purine NTP pyrophosphatase [Pseudoflavonifractor sp.]|nr:RdgB/HAM1 family non-canonical purine NTP pyrophosphatase [Alloprevotella sp.]MCM1116945.1 RdgB/HAM1 family non-canonical purine NTP pyrophosphatase [Pseudoflavonifractor sp.]
MTPNLTDDMRPTLVVATNNAHKLSEIRAILGHQFIVKGLADIGCTDDIAETATTLQGNAEIKARYVKEKYGLECIADDTGLLVDALGGAPGVMSARYAGPGHDSKANMAKLLRELDGVERARRTARFVTVVALTLPDGGIQFFEGMVEGHITLTPHGSDGFGYDPIFAPSEAPGLTFAEMNAEAKNAISHRGRAIRALADYLMK